MTLTYYKEELEKTARSLSRSGSGILAIDESPTTCGKRFDAIKLENTPKNRRDYRRLLLSTADLEKYISGVILHEETLYQDAEDEEFLAKKLQDRGIIPGVKVDQGLTDLTGGITGETYTSGIEGLVNRCKAYYDQGARFAKWRAVLKITSNGAPSELAISENAWGLARYARCVQEAGLVPIIEPEILMDGDHPLKHTALVQEVVIKAVYDACDVNGVYLEGTLLKPSMTLPGVDSKESVSAQEIAQTTVRVMEHSVPASVPGVVFLSGGLSEEAASIYLNEINKCDKRGKWNLAFSFGRALQQSCLKSWAGANVEEGQKGLIPRATANSQAALGQYEPGSQPSSDEKLFIAGYTY